MIRLALDYENTSETWWKAGGRELWDALLEGFEDGQVVVDDSIADSWLGEAAKISGWAEGPEYAPHPIRALEVDEDEEF